MSACIAPPAGLCWTRRRCDQEQIAERCAHRGFQDCCVRGDNAAQIEALPVGQEILIGGRPTMSQPQPKSKRFFVGQEIIETEKRYVGDLSVLLVQFHQPLKADPRTLTAEKVSDGPRLWQPGRPSHPMLLLLFLAPDLWWKCFAARSIWRQVEEVFGQIRMLHRLHRTLLTDLEAAGPLGPIGPVFLRFAPFLKMCDGYI